jgi:hypothetical protein
MRSPTLTLADENVEALTEPQASHAIAGPE